jgi:hypothetical protein
MTIKKLLIIWDEPIPAKIGNVIPNYIFVFPSSKATDCWDIDPTQSLPPQTLILKVLGMG